MLKTVEYFLRYSGEAVVGVHLRKTKWGGEGKLLPTLSFLSTKFLQVMLSVYLTLQSGLVPKCYYNF